MTLQASGPITFAEIAAELGKSLPLTIPDAETRWLADRPSGSVTIPTHFHSKQSIKVVATRNEAASGTSHTFSGVDFGPAFSDRRLIACTCLYTALGTTLDISSVTIGGNATLGDDRDEFLSDGTTVGAGLFDATVGSGTSGDVVLNWGSSSADRAGLVLLSTTIDSVNQRADDAGSGSGGTSVGVSIDVPSNGILVFCAVHGNTNNTSLSGVTERTEFTVGGARLAVGFDNRMSSDANRSVSASWSGTAARAAEAITYSQ